MYLEAKYNKFQCHAYIKMLIFGDKYHTSIIT